MVRIPNLSLLFSLGSGLLANAGILYRDFFGFFIFKTQKQIEFHPIDLPAPFNWENLIEVISRKDHLVFTGLLNSFIATGVSLVIIVFFSSVIGYFIARNDKRWVRMLFLFFLVGLMVPSQVTLMPVVKILQSIGLMGTYTGLMF